MNQKPSVLVRDEGSLRGTTLVEGGAEGNRTPDLFNAIEALSQLSYSPMPTTRLRNVEGTAPPERGGGLGSAARLPGEFGRRAPTGRNRRACTLPGSLVGWPTTPVHRRCVIIL